MRDLINIVTEGNAPTDMPPAVCFHVSRSSVDDRIRHDGLKQDRLGRAYVWDTIEMARWFADFQNDEQSEHTIWAVDTRGLSWVRDPETEDMSEWSSKFAGEGGAWITTDKIAPDRLRVTEIV